MADTGRVPSAFRVYSISLSFTILFSNSPTFTDSIGSQYVLIYSLLPMVCHSVFLYSLTRRLLTFVLLSYHSDASSSYTILLLLILLYWQWAA